MSTSFLLFLFKWSR